MTSPRRAILAQAVRLLDEGLLPSNLPQKLIELYRLTPAAALAIIAKNLDQIETIFYAELGQ